MKKVLILPYLLLSCLLTKAQQPLFTEVKDIANVRLSALDNQVLEKTANEFVNQRTIVKLNLQALKVGRITLNTRQKSVGAEITTTKSDSPAEHSFFGVMDDGSGFFVTVDGEQVVSKFYIDDIPYTLLPLNSDYHVLIRYEKGIDNGKCGLIPGQSKQQNAQLTEANQQTTLSPSLSSTYCRMRVLLVVTAQAESQIPISLNLAARALEDETNLAYQQSQVNYRMEIVRVVRTNYTETNGRQNSTEYGEVLFMYNDLLNLRSGSGLLSAVPTIRNNYSADIVVMIRSGTLDPNLFGAALGVPTGSHTPSSNNGFAFISTRFLTGGRFTFAHEIGHIQGARHENHEAIPTYAKGHIYSAGGSVNRTIMAVGCTTSINNGCRVQYFSNPVLSVGGIPIGIANQRDNTRRINETATHVLNFRATAASLLMPAETFEAGILARQYATSSLSTNNNTITVSANSDVSFKAGNDIRLLPGFTAAAGSKFIAYLGNCSDAPLHADNALRVENISTEEKVSSFSLFPNPAQSYIRISKKIQSDNSSSVDIREVNIYDQSGNIKAKQAFNGTNQIQISILDFKTGVYYAEAVLSNGLRERQVFMVQR